MLSLYNNEIIDPEDSIILIITEKISENIGKTIEDVYKKGQEKLLIDNLSDKILEQNEKLGENKYNFSHFRNAKDNQLPGIVRTDPMAKLLRLAPGDLCEITRDSERCGEYKFYRICTG